MKYFIYVLLLCPLYPQYYSNTLVNNIEEKYGSATQTCESALHIKVKNNIQNNVNTNNLPKKIKPKEIIID